MTEKEKRQAVQLMASGASQNKTAKILNVSQSSLCVKTDLKIESDNIKKQLIQQWTKETATRINDVSKDLLKIIEQSAKEIPARLKDCTAPQVALVMGICADKMQLLTGGATSNIQVDFKDDADVLMFLKHGNDSKIKDIVESKQLNIINLIRT